MSDQSWLDPFWPESFWLDPFWLGIFDSACKADAAAELCNGHGLRSARGWRYPSSVSPSWLTSLCERWCGAR